MHKILILEDDWALANQIKQSLRQFDYQIDLVQDLKRCEIILIKNSYDLLIFDRLINGEDSISLLEELRQKKYFTRALVMSQKKLLTDRLLSLKIADDFLAKPFVMSELSLKVQNLLSRSKIFLSKTQRCQSFSLADSGVVNDYVHLQKIHLAKKEAKILECLLLHQNQAVS